MIQRKVLLLTLSFALVNSGCSRHPHLGVYLSELGRTNYLELKEDKTYLSKYGDFKEVGSYEVEDQTVRLISKLGQAVDARIVGDTLVADHVDRWVLWKGGKSGIEFERAIEDIPRQRKVFHDDLASLALSVGSVERSTRIKRIPKPNGEERTITVPSNRLKAFLSRLDSVVLRHVPLHPLLYHRPGSSYIEMIKQHRNSRCLITADIDDFYPTVSPNKVLKALVSEGMESSVGGIVARLTTAFHSLPQGFPTSPTLAGIVLKPVGTRLAGLAYASHLRMGLYADNLAISAEYNASNFEGLIKRIFVQSGFKLDKWQVMTQADRQEIMHIVINNGLSVRAEYRNEIRRDMYVLAKLKKSQMGGDCSSRLSTLRGKLNYVYQINPDQFHALTNYAKRLGVKI